MPFQTFTAKLIRSVPLSDLTKHLEFEMQGVPRFGFVAGQWLSFKTNKPDGEEIIRAYSIASPPADNNRLALCLNRVQDGFMSNFLCDMKEGEEISCQGPFGDFILRPPMRDTIFIATGTGIAPFRSMLHWLLASDPEAEKDGRGRPPSTNTPARHQGHQLYMLFGNRTEKDIYYHDEFQRLAREHANFDYLPTLSRGGPEWKGLRGYVQEHVPGIVAGRTGLHAYICGLDKMVKANRDLLKSLGWDRKSILYEKYD
ncbi:MAG TPA: FAD-dependent oxidoreductase [Terriglobales bacterium]|jgi:ferredoxin-NADP reductase|nr:FAD-dependent oxidoreductase [Terriglobales bacterium]